MSEAKARPLDLRQFNNKPDGGEARGLLSPLQVGELRIDWSVVIGDLSAAGYSYRMIALQAGFDEDRASTQGKGMIAKLRSGMQQQPSFHNGMLLLGFWSEVMERSASQAPQKAA